MIEYSFQEIIFEYSFQEIIFAKPVFSYQYKFDHEQNLHFTKVLTIEAHFTMTLLCWIWW